MTLDLQSTDRKQNVIFQVSDIKQKGNIYEAIIKKDGDNKHGYILNMWTGNIPTLKSNGTIFTNGNIPNLPASCNYNINPIQYSHCDCCLNNSVITLNKPPLSLLKIDFNLNAKI